MDCALRNEPESLSKHESRNNTDIFGASTIIDITAMILSRGGEKKSDLRT